MKIVFSTTCKGRAFHVAQTLPRNLADNPNSKFVVLDYGSPDNLQEVLHDNECDRLVGYKYHTEAPFHMAHAKNMAHRVAMREGADVLVTLDADNFTGPGFEDFVQEKFEGAKNLILCPDWLGIKAMYWTPERPLRGYAGRLAVRAQDFVKAGGYDELYDTWRGEDIDFHARMMRMGYAAVAIDNCYLKTVPHTDNIRFKEFPHAKGFAKPNGWQIAGREGMTVVNNGDFGVGTVYRNGDATPIELRPLPTRVFGIGLHKTATTSLHKAFQMLGFDSLHWGEGEAPQIWQQMNTEGRSTVLERFYAACDLPIPLLYQKLAKAYPGSKFILTIRDEQKWLKSVEGLWDYKRNPTRWTWDKWPISNRLHQALYGRMDFDAATMLARYRRHNAEVRDYFRYRSDDLLVMDMDSGAGWKDLCGFLGAPIPSEPYPHEYKTKTDVIELTNEMEVHEWGPYDIAQTIGAK